MKTDEEILEIANGPTYIQDGYPVYIGHPAPREMAMIELLLDIRNLLKDDLTRRAMGGM